MLEPADWLKVDVRSGAGRSLKAPLFRAIGVKKGYRPRVLDATAGYGIDAWLMAASGCEVIAAERVAEVYKALEKSHAAAREVEPETAGRITLRFGEALDVMRDVAAVDVIYMDPMFAAERKAAPKRAMVELAEAVGGEADIDEVGRVAAAGLRIARRRVVIKRAARASAIKLPDGRAADVVYQGRGFRFDVYVNKWPDTSGVLFGQ